ncbi:hypothetical protein EVB27_075 [Rhizobium phage RHph_TM16]|nr:hypothetical protein EVB27_075 [Rhizobium phage RHph_TM16]
MTPKQAAAVAVKRLPTPALKVAKNKLKAILTYPGMANDMLQFMVEKGSTVTPAKAKEYTQMLLDAAHAELVRRGA